MDIIYNLCVKYGILTFSQTVYTQIPTTAASTFPIVKSFPTDIGLCYGMAIILDGVKADAGGQSVITLSDSVNLFLNIKVSSTAIISTWRLDQIAYIDPAGTGTIMNDRRYTPVFLPGSINWEQSNYQNPTGLTTGDWIALDFKYIDPSALQFLLAKGEITPYTQLMPAYAKNDK